MDILLCEGAGIKNQGIYLNMILNLVNKGFIVFAIDPVGQGERLQYSDSELKLVSFTSSTQEHTFMANQCLLAGNSLAKYFIWDGIRAIDYLLEVRAPKPTMIASTTRDFFSIQGARETCQEVKKAYDALGYSNNLSMSEGDLGHGFIKNNNEATYAFFQRELDLPGDPGETPVQFFTENELQITPTGQVLTSFRGETVFYLINASGGNVNSIRVALYQSGGCYRRSGFGRADHETDGISG